MELITYDINKPRDRYIGRKGVVPTILDYEEQFRLLNIRPIMADELDISTEEGQAFFNELVYSSYEGDMFTNVPRCPCGHLNSGEDEGERCPKCGHYCQAPTEQTIEPLVWIRPPEDVGVFMNPQVYQMLKSKMITNGFSIIDWLMDPKYKGPKLVSVQEDLLNNAGIKRGIRNFYENFDDIMELVFSLRTVIYNGERRTSEPLIKVATARQIREWLEITRDKIFTKVLPFPSKIGFIIEKVGSMKFVDPEMRPALNAMISIAKADKECRNLADAESRVARAVRDLAQYYQKTEETKIYPKEGVLRKLVYGTTPHFTFRTVITSEHRPHDHETIRIPWGAAVLLFKLHIGNKVLKEGFTPNEWLSFIYDNVQRHHPKLDRIFDELIAESPDGRGPVCLYTRFPSLKHNSSTRFFINIKRNPRHMSTSISVLTLNASTADFDGDYMSGQLALDNYMAKVFARHAPYTGIMDHKVPHLVSNHPMLPHPFISAINHSLEATDELCVPYEG